MASLKSVKLAEGEMSNARFRQIIAEIRQRAAEREDAPVNGNFIFPTAGHKGTLADVERKRDSLARDRLGRTPEKYFPKI